MKDICTSPKQSERLVELGLDVNTADMYYIVSEDVYSFHYALNGAPIQDDDLPAWSLSAMLRIIKYYELRNTPDLPNETITIRFKYRDTTLVLHGNDEVDVAFEMLCLLLKKNLIIK